MRTFRLLLLVPLALAGCQQSPASTSPSEAALSEAAPSPSASPVPSQAASGTPITQVGDLLGEYRVAGIDGQPLDAPIGIGVSIDGPMLSFEPTCAGFVWRIAFEGGRLVTEREAGQGQGPDNPPPPVCAVAVHPVQRQLAEALDAADSAVRTPANGIELAGGGRSVTLFSQ